MNIRRILLRIVSFVTLPVAIYSVLPYLDSPSNFITAFDNPLLWWLVQLVILFVFFVSKKYFIDKNTAVMMITIQMYLYWNTLSIAYGVFVAENYWDWKNLAVNAMGLLIPVMAFVATNTTVIQSILKNYIKYTLPLFLFFSFLIVNGAYGFYLVPISFLMLFFPILSLRWKLIILTVTLFVIIADFGARSNIIKFGVPVLLCSIYYYRQFFSTLFIESVRKLLFITPFILFFLAVSNVFNVFKMDDYISSDFSFVTKRSDGAFIEDSLKADTRTFIYAEVLETADKYNCWLFGRSPARGNDSASFGESDMSGRGERSANEVGIVNIFTWTGIIGVILYLMVFYKASYLAINRSSNTFSKIIGIYISFRWVFAWVEDINNFSLNYIFLWLMIGLCFSKSFRAMSNKDVEYWVQGIFIKRVRSK